MVSGAHLEEGLTFIDQEEIVPVGVSLRDAKLAGHGTWNAVNT
jgi:hypothetical protein